MGRIDRIDVQMGALVLIWGSAFLGIKVLGDALDPYQLTWYRYLPFPLLYGGYLLARRRDVLRSIRGRDWAVMPLLGFVGVVGYHFPLNWGLHGHADSVSGATGSILIATNPLWTLLLAAALGRERLRVKALAGFVVAFLGVAIIVLGGSHGGFTLARKSLVVLLAPLSWAIYSIFTKPLAERYGGIVATGTTLSMGTLMLVPAGLSFGVAPLAALDGREWGWLVFLALLSTAAGYALWNDALKHRKASEVAVFVYAQPVVTALLGALPVVVPAAAVAIDPEPVSAYFALGAALVLAGVVWVNRLRLAAPTPAAPIPPENP